MAYEFQTTSYHIENLLCKYTYTQTLCPPLQLLKPPSGSPYYILRKRERKRTLGLKERKTQGVFVSLFAYSLITQLHWFYRHYGFQSSQI